MDTHPKTPPNAAETDLFIALIAHSQHSSQQSYEALLLLVPEHRGLAHR